MLNLFKNIDSIPEEKIHPKFRLLRDSVMMERQRTILKSWTEGFVDRDNKIIEEFQTTFHSSFWEFYLHHLFRQQGLTIDFSHDRPDFVITEPYDFLVEAVIANIKETGRNEKTRNAYDIIANLDPPHEQKDFNLSMNEAITRYANALDKKKIKLKNEYLKLNWVSENKPFVIALSSYSQVNYGKEFYYPMLALLYGLYYDHILDDYISAGMIPKPGNGAPINLRLFDDPDMDHVSAIMFSCTVTLGKLTSLSNSMKEGDSPNLNTVLLIRHQSEHPHYWVHEVCEEYPELHSDGLFIFHNPNAKNPLPIDIFKNSSVLQVWAKDDDQLAFAGNGDLIYSRLNLPNAIMPPEIKTSIMTEVMQRFNT